MPRVTDNSSGQLSASGQGEPGGMFEWILLSPGFPLKPQLPSPPGRASRRANVAPLLGLWLCDVCRDRWSSRVRRAQLPLHPLPWAAAVLGSVPVLCGWAGKATSPAAIC